MDEDKHVVAPDEKTDNSNKSVQEAEKDSDIRGSFPDKEKVDGASHIYVDQSAETQSEYIQTISRVVKEDSIFVCDNTCTEKTKYTTEESTEELDNYSYQVEVSNCKNESTGQYSLNTDDKTVKKEEHLNKEENELTDEGEDQANIPGKYADKLTLKEENPSVFSAVEINEWTGVTPCECFSKESFRDNDSLHSIRNEVGDGRDVETIQCAAKDKTSAEENQKPSLNDNNTDSSVHKKQEQNDDQQLRQNVFSEQHCALCKELGRITDSTHVCRVCEELYCDTCTASHRALKATRQHKITKLYLPIFFCDICSFNKIQQTASASCKKCQEFYCSNCIKIHSFQKATREHTLCIHDKLNERTTCEPCSYDGNGVHAKHICIECDEVLCGNCCNRHSKQRATSNHVILNASKLGDNCVLNHEDSESSCKKNENVQDVGNRRYKTRDKSMISEKVKESGTVNEQQEDKYFQPGKPCTIGDRHIDFLCIRWDEPKHFFQEFSYQLRYKEIKDDSKWLTHPDQTSMCRIKIGNLKSSTKYVFQVRMVNNDGEGPYSEISDPIKTIKSAASELFNFMTDVSRSDIHIPLKKLPLTEDSTARNSQDKTRKLIFGSPNKTKSKEKTIMLVGATGSGKSTLVDGMINYIVGVSWNDSYRVTAIDLEDNETNRNANQAMSQTQWITLYRLHPLKGSRLQYTLNIIDTPGFGDTRGIERDKEIIEQIRRLFSRDDDSGVVFIDAICFLVKAPDARLTPTQMYIFNAIMSLFGRDVKNNFCMLVTFADGKRPPVLSALKEAKLPHEEYFPFNNSGIFAENEGSDVCSFSQMFWDMGCKSFRQFFERIETLETRSLRQTRDVLDQRESIEISMENLQQKLDFGLVKVEELRLEINILEDFKTTIEGNKDFTYDVNETEQKQIDLPPGQHVTNCLNCHTTCHRNCRIPNDEDKRRCKAMDKDGNCRECPSRCFWNMHRNTPYIFEYVTVKKTKTYQEKLDKYRKAQNETITRETVVSRMRAELDDLENEIVKLMTKINESTNVLKQIALRPDPLTVAEHISLLIEGEKLEKRNGYEKRIAALQQCMRKININDDVERLRTSIHATKSVSARVYLPIKAPRKGKKGSFGILQPFVNYFK